MKRAGQIVLFRLPQTDLEEGKLRPALLLGKLPGEYDDWLVCMISSQIHRCHEGFDEIVQEDDGDFAESGLKVASVIPHWATGDSIWRGTSGCHRADFSAEVGAHQEAFVRLAA